MFLLGGLLLRWRLKWIICLGLAFGVLRFVLCALNTRPSLLAGVAMHGFSFTFVFITAQIYLDQRVDKAWRARAQALMSLVTGGMGNLLGFLGTGWWIVFCTQNGVTRWPVFWGGVAVTVASVAVLFLITYRGRANPSRPG
jgi:MFS family permease